MRIIFMGTPEQAAAILEQLVRAKREILAVITQPDRPKGRGRKLAWSPVKEVALKHALPLEQPEKLKVGSFVSLLESFKPDIIVVVAYGKILPKEIIDIPKYGCINVHASLLPKYRGAAPMQWALLSGEKMTGITIMKINERLDAGEIILQEKVKITENDNTLTLSKKLFDRGGKLLARALKQIEQGKVKFVVQDEAEATNALAIARESGEIDWRKTAWQVHNRIRAMVPWPVAHTFFKKKLLKIWQSEVHVVDLATRFKLPGTVVDIVKDTGFIVATGQGHLLIKEVQLAGGKRMPAYVFVHGHDVRINETLPN